MVKTQIAYTEISPSEFFYRNRDLAGFTNPSRALYSAVRELVENSLDACEYFGILPDIYLRISPIDTSQPDPKPYAIKIKDNGPGIDLEHVPNAFGKIFFGSKFRLRQSRGMFGMGVTMVVLYGQITTNKPVVVSTSSDGTLIHTLEILINIQDNTPTILRRNHYPAIGETGTSVEVTLEGDFPRASSKIYEYLRQTAMVTPYANISFIDPQGRVSFFKRVTEEMPNPPQETLPHPYGIDVEAFKRMLKQSKQATLLKFMQKNFHRVGKNIAQKFLQYVGINQNRSPSSLTNDEAVMFVEALHKFGGFLQPDASCLSPLGESLLSTGVKNKLKPEFMTVVIRPPSAYSGFPFITEVCLAYGGKVLSSGVKLYRFANRIPLLYDEANDVSSKVVNEEVDWRRYKIPKDAPLAIITHICSTKVPYKTVGKEYLADRPEIERELKNGVREVLRKLNLYLAKKGSIEMVKKRISIYGKYLPLIARFSTGLSGAKRMPRYKRLLERSKLADELQTKLEEYNQP